MNTKQNTLYNSLTINLIGGGISCGQQSDNLSLTASKHRSKSSLLGRFIVLFLFAGACMMASCGKKSDDLRPHLAENDSTIFTTLQGTHRMLTHYDEQNQAFVGFAYPVYCRFTADSVFFLHVEQHTTPAGDSCWNEEVYDFAYSMTFRAPYTFYFDTLRYDADPDPQHGTINLWALDGSAYGIASQVSDTLEVGVMWWKGVSKNS